MPLYVGTGGVGEIIKQTCVIYMLTCDKGEEMGKNVPKRLTYFMVSSF